MRSISTKDQQMNAIDQSTRADLAQGNHRGAVPQGIPLLGAVFTELSRHLGEAYSTAHVLRAAQQLINLARAKHRERAIRDPPEHSGYFSLTLDTALRAHSWTIACFEQPGLTHCDDDGLTYEATERLRQILQDQLN
jgi:hypothetical protein